MGTIRRACLAAFLGSFISSALASPVNFDVLLTPQFISGQPAGLTSLPAFPFQLTASLDSTALTPNLQEVTAGSRLLNIALVLGNVTYSTPTFGSVVLISTDNAGQLTQLIFGSEDGGHRLFGVTGQGWSFSETLQGSCQGGVIPPGADCIGGVGPRSTTLRSLTAVLPVPEPAAISVLAAGLAGLVASRRRRDYDRVKQTAL